MNTVAAAGGIIFAGTRTVRGVAVARRATGISRRAEERQTGSCQRDHSHVLDHVILPLIAVLIEAGRVS